MGKIPYHQVFEDSATPLKEVRGELVKHWGYRWLTTYHPSTAMRFPALRGGFEQDLVRFAEELTLFPKERRK